MEAEQGKQDAMVLDDVVPPLVDDSMALDAPDLDAVGAYGPMLPPAEFKEYVLRLTDHTTPGTPPSRHEHRFHGARLVDLVDYVSEKIGLTSDLFHLKLLPACLSLANLPPSTPLSEVGLKVGQANVVHAVRPPEFTDIRHHDLNKVYDRRDRSPNAASQVPHSAALDGRARIDPVQLPSITLFSNTKSSTGYVGLANQGATCYLNSLIQTLFMTPEFRRGLYQWNFEDWVRAKFERKLTVLEGKSAELSPEDREQRLATYRGKMAKASIARQLQRLFVGLQTSEERATKTRALTESFGWVGSEAFEQHDVQELMRILLEALEDVRLDGVSSTAHADEKQYSQMEEVGMKEIKENIGEKSDDAVALPKLFEGEIKDYVQCPVCGFESSRKTPFLDVQLVIRAFGADEPIQSVEEALRKYTEVETLDLANAWRCEKCEKPVEGRKGLQFSVLPYLLCLQLKRFDFDPLTMSKVKLNDRVSFPETLHMAEFLAHNNSSMDARGESRMEVDERLSEQSATVSVNATPNGSEMMEIDNEMTNSEKAMVGAACRLEYELYAVLVHRGSHIGGHYYAYIKSFSSRKWVLFDDSSVTEVPFSRVEEAFGSSTTSAGAYMLVYRQKSALLNQSEPTVSDIPPSLLVKDEEGAEEVLLRLRYDKEAVELTVSSKATLSSLISQAMKELGVVIAEEHVRVRELDKKPGRVLDLKQTVLSILPKTFGFSRSVKELLIENKPSSSEAVAHLESKEYTVHVLEADGGWKDILLAKSDLLRGDIGGLKRSLVDKGIFPASTPLESIAVVRWGLGNVLPSDKEIIYPPAEFFAELTEAKQSEQPLLEAGMELDDVEKGFFDDEDTDDARENDNGANAHAPMGLQEMQRRKDSRELLVNVPGSEKLFRIVTVNVKWPLARLRMELSRLFGLDYAECKLISAASRQEITGETTRIEHLSYSLGDRVTLKKERFTQDGELGLKVNLFEANAAPGKPVLSPLCSVVVHPRTTFSELRHMIVKERPELAPPEGLRFREYSWNAPGRVYKPDEVISVITGYSKEVAVSKVQNNGANNDKRKTEENVVFLQTFDPQSYGLGERIEVTVDDALSLSAFRDLTIRMTGVAHPAVAKASEFIFESVSDIPRVYQGWKAFPEDLAVRMEDEKEQYVQVKTIEGEGSVRSLFVSDGNLLLVMDVTMPLKVLSEDEKMVLDAKQKRIATAQKQRGGRVREERLRITQQDYDI